MTNPQEDTDQESRVLTINVNGRERQVHANVLTFAEIVALAENLPAGPNVTYTVTYRRGHGDKPDGTLVEGSTIRIKNGMIFSVRATDKS
jgi:Multiubiquitin